MNEKWKYIDQKKRSVTAECFVKNGAVRKVYAPTLPTSFTDAHIRLDSVKSVLLRSHYSQTLVSFPDILLMVLASTTKALPHKQHTRFSILSDYICRIYLQTT